MHLSIFLWHISMRFFSLKFLYHSKTHSVTICWETPPPEVIMYLLWFFSLNFSYHSKTHSLTACGRNPPPGIIIYLLCFSLNLLCHSKTPSITAYWRTPAPEVIIYLFCFFPMNFWNDSKTPSITGSWRTLASGVIIHLWRFSLNLLYHSKHVCLTWRYLHIFVEVFQVFLMQCPPTKKSKFIHSSVIISEQSEKKTICKQKPCE